MKVYISEKESDTESIAYDFASKLKGGDVVAFKGGLGAGKTTFTRYACEKLGVKLPVTSPTFAIVNDYGITDNGFHIYHFDMYRVNSWDSLYSTGFFDYLDSDSIIFIEWSENIEEAVDDGSINLINVNIEPLGENRRKFIIDGGGRW